MSEERRKVFVGRLPRDIRKDEVDTILSTYGRITDLNVLVGDRSDPCAFVTFETEHEAQVAIRALNGVYKFRLDSVHPVNVRIAQPRGGRGGDARGRQQERDDRGDRNSYDDDRRGGDRFDRGGVFDRGGGGHDRGADRDRGYGGGGCARSRSPRRSSPPPHCGTKLYIGNLPANITKQALDVVFGTYGELDNIYVMAGRAKNGQSCAFVKYTSSRNAAGAIAAMRTGYEIRPGEGNIIVKYANEGRGDRGDRGERGREY